MSTLTRTKPTGYKDYVNFLGNYKSGKKDDQISIQSTDSGVSVKSFPLSTSSSNTSASSLNSDVTDFFAKPPKTPYQNYLDNQDRTKNTENKTMRTEIYIEVQNPVSEVSKIFQPSNEEKKISKNSATISKKISMFEQVVEEKPQIKKPINRSKSNVSEIAQQLEAKQKQQINEKKEQEVVINRKKESNQKTEQETDWIIQKIESSPKNQIPPQFEKPIISEKPKIENNVPPPPPPMMPNNFAAPKTVTKNQNGIDRNDPAIKKLVYGALRDMYGAYHGKANDFVATLPRNMVKKDNEVQSIIEQIASKGDLEKLNGRVNPKSDS